MTAFGSYARYYDLLYRDKDYRGETDFVEELIRKHTADAQRVLELGCGTGIHGIMLAEQGYEVQGLDISETMLEMAAQRVASLPAEVAQRIRFFRGDARDFTVDGNFDAIVSLFHVLSYQVTDDDLRAVFSGVKSCLAPGGVFIFDCWYGPAVLSDPPEVRVKTLEDDRTSVTRIATPTLHGDENRVDVHYQLSITDKQTQAVEELTELHRMRYLFRPEVELLAAEAGLQVVSSGAWLSDRAADTTTWYVYFTLTHANRD
jgi:SAM-dependent methyltransferase